MNYIFANVDKTKVPYGILRDYGMEFTNIENYKGTVTFSAPCWCFVWWLF